MPLLHKQILIPHVTLNRPYMDLERLKEGKTNWEMSSSSSGWEMHLHEVSFDAGLVDLKDELKKGY